jgi:hypothetical protein
LAPAAPNRDRRFFTCREVITTTVRPVLNGSLDAYESGGFPALCAPTMLAACPLGS